MKRIELSLLMALLFCGILSICTLNIECREIRGSVLRLHVLANSDDAGDQALKLKVRDRLLEVSTELYAGAETKEEAVAATREHLDELRREAERVVRENGCNYPVTVALEETYFNTRTYGDITLPAGNYQAVRVLIGKGKGHNWWCVMFPPLCISAASGDEVQMEDVLTDQQMDMVEGSRYEMKFKCVELYEEWKEHFHEQQQKES